MIRSTEEGRAVPLPFITSWLVGDEMVMGVIIHMLDKSLSNGRISWNYLQFNTVRQLQAAASDIYSVTADAHSSCNSLKYHCGIVIHIYEGAIQSLLMERFSNGVKKRMP